MDEDTPKGAARITGDESLLPSRRQVHVARAYVAGLEQDRVRLRDKEAQLTKTTWEVIRLGAYNRALVLAVTKVLSDLDQGRYDPSLVDRIENLIADSKLVYDDIFECACGHSKYDHDDSGCLYLGCKSICG